MKTLNFDLNGVSSETELPEGVTNFNVSVEDADGFYNVEANSAIVFKFSFGGSDYEFDFSVQLCGIEHQPQNGCWVICSDQEGDAVNPFDIDEEEDLYEIWDTLYNEAVYLSEKLAKKELKEYVSSGDEDGEVFEYMGSFNDEYVSASANWGKTVHRSNKGRIKIYSDLSGNIAGNDYATYPTTDDLEYFDNVDEFLEDYPEAGGLL